METKKPGARLIALARARGSGAGTVSGAVRFLRAAPVERMCIPDDVLPYCAHAERSGDPRAISHEARMVARGARLCEAWGLWSLDDSESAAARARAEYVELFREQIESADRLFRRSYSSWVGGHHTISIHLVDDPEESGSASGDSETVWHPRHVWSGTDSTHDYYIHRRVIDNLGPSRVVVGRLVHVDARPVEGCRDLVWVTWAVQGRGVSLGTQTGYLVRGRYHVAAHADTPRARARARAQYRASIVRRLETRADRARQRAESSEERRILARVWVTQDDSRAGGNCAPATEAYAEQLAGELGCEGELGAVRADVLLAHRDDMYTRRAVAAARKRMAI